MRLLLITSILVFSLVPVLLAQSPPKADQPSAGISREQESFYVAKKAYEDGFYDVALNLFRRFLKNFPQSQMISETNLYIAQCYLQQNKFIDALGQLERLSSDPGAENIKDKVLYWLAEVHFRGKDFKKAISFYQKIIDEFSHSDLLAHAYYSRGWCQYEMGEYSMAIESFDKVVTDFPEQPLTEDSLFKNLECLYNLNEFEKLKEEILRFKKRYSKSSKYTGLIDFLSAECYFYLTDYEKAIQDYQLALKNSSDQDIIVASKLGTVWSYIKLKNYTQAEAILKGINSDDLVPKQKELLLLAEATLFTEIQNFQDADKVWSELRKIATNPETKMQAYLGEAEALYNLQQYLESINIYQEAKEIAEEVPSQLVDKLYYGLAWAFLKNGQFKEAIDEFQKAASFAQDEIIKVASLCQVGDTYQDAEDYQKAIEVYDEILKNYPSSFYADYAQYQLGLAFLRSSRYDEAILAFRSLLLNFPESKLKTQTIYNLALGLFQKQDYQGCYEALKKHMLDLQDADIEVEAIYLLGTSQYNLGNFEEAMGLFKQVIRKAKDVKITQKAEYEIADCLYHQGREKEALERFNALRSKYPDSTLSPEVTWWLGGYYFRKGDLKLSRRYFSSLIKDFPESGLLADGYYALGLIEQEEARFDQALTNFKKAIRIGSRDLAAQANVAVADILIEQGKLEEAEVYYRQAIDRSPALAGLIYPKISRIYEKRGDFSQAIHFYKQALHLASMKEAANLQFKIASAYEKNGDSLQAVEEYLKIPYLYPTDSQLVVKAYLSSAQIYENKEDWASAKDIYLKVASMDVGEAKYAKERLIWIERNKN